MCTFTRNVSYRTITTRCSEGHQGRAGRKEGPQCSIYDVAEVNIIISWFVGKSIDSSRNKVMKTGTRRRVRKTDSRKESEWYERPLKEHGTGP